MKMNSTEERKFQQVYTRFYRLLQLLSYSEAACDSYNKGLRQFAHWCAAAPTRASPSGNLRPILAN